MTDALKLMVEAMHAELREQAGSTYHVSREIDGLGELRIDGDFNLSKVARAGLEAIADAGEQLRVRRYLAYEPHQFDDVISAIVGEPE